MTAQITECPRARDYFPWKDPSLRENPYPFYARALAEAPVTIDEDGTYVLTKYEDLMRYGRMSSVVIRSEWERAGAWSILLDMAIGHDEPHHTRLRRLTAPWFTPKRVQEWIKITEEVTEEILDRIGDDGLVDGSDLAVEATHRTICRVLQVPEDDIDNVRRFMRQAMPILSAEPEPEDVEACEEAHQYLQGRTAELIEYARANPGDGLVHALLDIEDRGETTAAETFGTLLFFYFVGHMDASYLISSGLRLFAERPEVFETFRSTPEVREAMVVELARYDAPEPVITRATTEDMEIRGVTIPARSVLRLLLGAANRDPDVYSNPDEFDFRRPPAEARNMTFSFGTHSCQGRLLAEAEIRVVWERIGQRFSRIEKAGEVEMTNTDASRHFIRLPLRFVP